MAAGNFFGFDLTSAYIQTAPSSAVANTFTDAGDLVTAAAHGLSNGAVVVFQTIVTTTGATVNVRYYVISATTNTFQVSATYGGSAVVLTTDGSGTYKNIIETSIVYPNKVEMSPEVKTVTYEGGGQTRQRVKTTGFTANLSPDCFTLAAHETIFAKTAGATALPSGYTRAVPMLDATEGNGVTAGLRAIGTSQKITLSTGAESTVTIELWVPSGTLSLSGPPGMTTSDKFGQQTYHLAATRGTTDVAAGTLPTAIQNCFYVVME